MFADTRIRRHKFVIKIHAIRYTPEFTPDVSLLAFLSGAIRNTNQHTVPSLGDFYFFLLNIA